MSAPSCAPGYFHYAGCIEMSERCRIRSSAAWETESLAESMTMWLRAPMDRQFPLRSAPIYLSSGRSSFGCTARSEKGG